MLFGSDLIRPMLETAIQELATRSKNVKIAESVVDPGTALDEAKKQVKDMTIVEVQPPVPAPKDGKTRGKDEIGRWVETRSK